MYFSATHKLNAHFFILRRPQVFVFVSTATKMRIKNRLNVKKQRHLLQMRARRRMVEKQKARNFTRRAATSDTSLRQGLGQGGVSDGRKEFRKHLRNPTARTSKTAAQLQTPFWKHAYLRGKYYEAYEKARRILNDLEWDQEDHRQAEIHGTPYTPEQERQYKQDIKDRRNKWAQEWGKAQALKDLLGLDDTTPPPARMARGPYSQYGSESGPFDIHIGDQWDDLL